MVALCVLFCGPPDTGRVVVKAAVRPPVTAQTFRAAAWEAVEWDTYRVIRVDTRDEHGYLALTPPQNTDTFMFSVRSVSFPGRGRVLLDAVGITEKAKTKDKLERSQPK
jgi:hypothetical protein